MELSMLSTSSKTFTTINGFRVNVRAVQPQRPTGLMAIGWTWPGYDINVTILEEKQERLGSLMARPSGNFAWSLGTWYPHWTSMNTLNAYNLQKLGLTPHSYKTADFAFNHLCNFIKCQLEGTRFVP